MIRVIIVCKRPQRDYRSVATPMAVAEWCKRWPTHLKTIAKAVAVDTGETLRDGTLTEWQNQGVLILDLNDPDATRRTLNMHDDVVVMAWGSRAQEMVEAAAANNAVCFYAPSPWCHRAFIDAKIFSRCNRYVKGDPIKWGHRY